MALFALGLVIFFGLHFWTATPALRGLTVAKTGSNPWKGIVALGSLIGVVLIIMGWHAAPNTPLFAPIPAVIQAAPVLVTVGLILFVIGGGNLQGYIRRTLHHPMLIGVLIWSLTHLLANGGLRETILFGAFALFSVYALCSLLAAGKRATFSPTVKWDVIGMSIGVLVAIGVMHAHQWLFGVPVK